MRLLKLRNLILAVGILLALTADSRAAVIAYDSFEEYAGGVQVESNANVGLNGGAGFSGPYNIENTRLANVVIADRTSSPLVYSNGAITLNGGNRAVAINDAAIATTLLTRAFPATDGITTPLYFSFLYRTNQPAPLDTDAVRDFLQFGLDGGTGGEPNASIGSTGGSQNHAFFARSNTGSGGNATSSVAFQADTTYLLVGKIFSQGGTAFDRVSLFVNPDTLTEPAATVTGSASTGIGNGVNFDRFTIRTADLDTGDTYLFDEFKIGTTFESVVTAIPEPNSVALILSGLGLLGWRLVKRRSA